MEITSIKTTNREVAGTNIIGQASCIIDNAVAVNSILIRRANNGQAYVQMPQQKNAKTEKYQDVAFPITTDGRTTISDEILKHFHNPDTPQNTESNKPCQIDVQLFNVQSDKSSVLARGSITVNNEFVVKGVKVVQNKDGIPFVSLPSSYNPNTKKSYSLISPANKNAYVRISDVVISAYNQNKQSAEEYVYENLTEQQLSKLSNTTDIKFDIGKVQEDGSAIVRINGADKPKLEQILGATANKI